MLELTPYFCLQTRAVPRRPAGSGLQHVSLNTAFSSTLAGASAYAGFIVYHGQGKPDGSFWRNGCQGKQAIGKLLALLFALRF
jgi:hypothetical protein